jgi:hypothetical protein
VKEGSVVLAATVPCVPLATLGFDIHDECVVITGTLLNIRRDNGSTCAPSSWSGRVGPSPASDELEDQRRRGLLLHHHQCTTAADYKPEPVVAVAG